MTIGSIQQIQAVQVAPSIAAVSKTAAGGTFESVLASAINTVEQNRLTAEDKVGKFLSGEGEEVHQVVMATQQADLSFEMFQQVRNKVVSAYQEVMRMQL